MMCCLGGQTMLNMTALYLQSIFLYLDLSITIRRLSFQHVAPLSSSVGESAIQRPPLGNNSQRCMNSIAPERIPMFVCVFVGVCARACAVSTNLKMCIPVWTAFSNLRLCQGIGVCSPYFAISNCQKVFHIYTGPPSLLTFPEKTRRNTHQSRAWGVGLVQGRFTSHLLQHLVSFHFFHTINILSSRETHKLYLRTHRTPYHLIYSVTQLALE